MTPREARREAFALRLRSVGASAASTALDVGLFALLTLPVAGLVYSTALLAGLRWLCGAIGAVANFLLNRWAFGVTGAKGERAGAQGLRYAAVAAGAVTLAAGVFWALARLTALDARLLSVLRLALVWLVFTFPMLRGWVFARR